MTPLEYYSHASAFHKTTGKNSNTMTLGRSLSTDILIEISSPQL
jgi:hypothetical protein